MLCTVSGSDTSSIRLPHSSVRYGTSDASQANVSFQSNCSGKRDVSAKQYGAISYNGCPSICCGRSALEDAPYARSSLAPPSSLFCQSSRKIFVCSIRYSSESLILFVKIIIMDLDVLDNKKRIHLL